MTLLTTPEGQSHTAGYLDFLATGQAAHQASRCPALTTPLAASSPFWAAYTPKAKEGQAAPKPTGKFGQNPASKMTINTRRVMNVAGRLDAPLAARDSMAKHIGAFTKACP